MPAETVTVDAPKVGQLVAAQIASAGTSQFKVAEIPATSTTAPKADNQPQAASAEVQPVQGAEISADVTTSKVDEPGNKQTEAKPEGEKEVAKDETPIEPDLSLLGFEKSEPETIDVVKERLAESSKEAHRLVEREKVITKALEDVGVELVQTRNGLTLRPTQKFMEGLKDDELPDVLAKLSEKERELVDVEVAKKIQKLTTAEVMARRPNLPENKDEPVIGQSEVQKVINSLAAAKTPDGKEMLQRFTDPQVQDIMYKIYMLPEAEGFREFMSRSATNYAFGQKMLHNGALRVLSPVWAKEEAKKAATEADKEKQKKAPSVASSGAGVQPVAMGGGNKLTPAQQIAKQIAEAKPK